MKNEKLIVKYNKINCLMFPDEKKIQVGGNVVIMRVKINS
jgi:hypothetical protein